MKKSNIGLALVFLALSFLSIPARGQNSSGTALIGGCKSGEAIAGYKRPGFEIRAHAHFACGSSVYVWKATTKTALVQQGDTVAYVARKYVDDARTSDEESPAGVRTFLQGIADALQSPDASALAARRGLVRSCLASRGCRVDAWSRLSWTRIKRANEIAESPNPALRFFDGGIYYSAFVVNPAVHFKDRPLPSSKSPVLVLAGGGLDLAVADDTCFRLDSDGKWAAAGERAVQAAAAIR